MNRYLIPIVLLSVWNGGMAQTVTGNDFDFLVNTIKSGYAGYSEKTTDQQFEKLVSEVRSGSAADSFAMLSRITARFNDLHLILYDFNAKNNVDSTLCSNNYQTITQYLRNKGNKTDTYEGYWLSELGNCIMGLQKVSGRPATYKGYILETTTKAPRGYCILSLTKDTGNSYLTDYHEEGLGYRVFLRSRFKSRDVLLVNSYGKWRRLPAYTPGMLQNYTPFSYAPELKLPDSHTVLIKMPDFGSYNVRKIDSLVKANMSHIEKAQHLIVDVRNNMGGSIRNYYPLLPFVCDKNIVQVSGLQLFSDELISSIKSDIEVYTKRNDTARANRSRRSLQRGLSNRGRFVLSGGDTISCAVTKALPKHVSVIINNMCLSATELMLLDFKQSGKVKIFGEVSGGAVDYLDALRISLPSGKYSLFMATTKRVKTTGNGQGAFDNTGIPPDVPIPDQVADWVTFVKGFYEKK
jgi:hypothetical protein